MRWYWTKIAFQSAILTKEYKYKEYKSLRSSRPQAQNCSLKQLENNFHGNINLQGDNNKRFPFHRQSHVIVSIDDEH